MSPEDAWGTWRCPLCTATVPVNPYVDHGLLEMHMHAAAHVEAGDDYLMGLV